MKKIKSRRGFTLIEIIAAIGVLAILCAIAIPAIVRASNSLTDRQANDYAKSIYLAVQDELASRRIDGSMEQLSKRNETDNKYASVYADKNAPALKDDIAAILADNDGTTDLAAELLEVDTEREYVYITTSNRDDLKEILPIGSIDNSIFAKGTKVTVIFNINTGDVLHVRFEGKKAVGRYDGTVISGATELLEELPLSVNIVNGQACYVRISVPVPEKLAANKQKFYNNIKFTVTVFDAADSSNYFRYQFTKDDFNKYIGKSKDMLFEMNYATGVARWTLDSLNPQNGSFSKKMEDCADKNGAIPAGSDVCVMVECIYNDTEDTDVSFKPGVAVGNPLFDKLNSGVITVINGRNLQNLNNIDRSLAAGVSKVEVTKDIKWDETASYYEDKIISNNILSFVPLTTEDFKEQKLDLIGKANGSKAKISNLYITGTGNVGLFGTLYGSVTGIDFVDPYIQTNEGGAGSVAGRALRDSKITNCSVTITNNSDAIFYGTDWVGLLVGCCSVNEVSGCSVTVEENVSLKACGRYFGLVAGDADDASFSNITAVGSISENFDKTTAIGGLVGEAANCTVKDIRVELKADKISGAVFGGVVGYANGGEYSTIAVSGSIRDTSANTDGKLEAVGGAVGCANGGSYSYIDTEVDLINITAASNTNKYACPSGINNVGKFVGHIYSGSFTDCTSKGDADKDYQFLGTVAISDGGAPANLYKSSAEFSDRVQAEQSLDDPYKYVADSATFEPVAAGDRFNCYNDISLTDCIYNSGSTDYRQEISSDLYFYTYNEDEMEEHAQYYFIELTGDNKDAKYSPEDRVTEFIITDSTKKHALALKTTPLDDSGSTYQNAYTYYHLDFGEYEQYNFTTNKFQSVVCNIDEYETAITYSQDQPFTTSNIKESKNFANENKNYKSYLYANRELIAEDVYDNSNWYVDLDGVYCNGENSLQNDQNLYPEYFYAYWDYSEVQISTIPVDFTESAVVRETDADGLYDRITEQNALWNNGDTIHTWNTGDLQIRSSVLDSLCCNIRGGLNFGIYVARVNDDDTRSLLVKQQQDESGNWYTSITHETDLGSTGMLSIKEDKVIPSKSYTEDTRLHFYIRKTIDNYDTYYTIWFTPVGNSVSQKIVSTKVN